MRNIILICVLTAVFALCVGGIYQLTLGDGDLIFIDVDTENEQDEPAEERKFWGSAQREPNTVTNPTKTCAEPDCDNAVFVTYRGVELCVQCYGEQKKANTEAEEEIEKVCSTPDCGRKVFVTYRGEELCTRCYSEKKNANS